MANVSRGEDTSRHEMTVAVKFAEIEDKTLSPTEPAKESMEGNTFADRLIWQFVSDKIVHLWLCT